LDLVVLDIKLLLVNLQTASSEDIRCIYLEQ
jgi:hypothetical protein